MKTHPWRARLGIPMCLTVLGLPACAGAPLADYRPACQAPRPAPTTSPDDNARIATARASYEAFISHTNAPRIAANKRVADAQNRGDDAAAQAAIADTLARSHPISALLEGLDLPANLQPDVLTYERTDEARRVADGAYVHARGATAIEAAVRQQNIARRREQNAINQFRADLGMAPQPCPYPGP